MSSRTRWQLIAVMFAVLIVGILVATDVSHVLGIVLLFAAAGIGLVVRLGPRA